MGREKYNLSESWDWERAQIAEEKKIGDRVATVKRGEKENGMGKKSISRGKEQA